MRIRSKQHFLGGILGVLLLIFLISRRDVFEGERQTNINLSGDYGTISLSDGHELKQPFPAEGSKLNQVFLWIEGTAEANGSLVVRICDEKDTLVTQSLELSEIGEDVWKIWIPVNRNLEKGREYTLVLNYQGSSDPLGELRFRSFESAGQGENGKVSMDSHAERSAFRDGKILTDGLTIVFAYRQIDGKTLAVSVFFCLLIGAYIAFFDRLGNLRDFIWQRLGCGRNFLPLFFLPAGAVFTCRLVEYVSGNSENLQWNFFAFNVLWYLIFYGAGYLVTDHAGWTAAVVNGIFYLFAVVDYFVVQFRGRPVLPWEIFAAKTAMSVASGYSLRWTREMILGGMTGILFVCFSFWLCPGGIRREQPRGERIQLRLLKDSMIALAGFLFIGMFSDSGFPARYGIDTDQWDIAGTYKKQGILLSTISYLELSKVQTPEGYSEKELQRIRDSLEQGTEQDTADIRTVPKNIIVIMNESLTDYDIFDGFRPDEDVLPFIHSLSANTIKGFLQVPVFGGGTCNTEYEALTGNNMTFLPAGVMPYQMYVKPDTISISKILNKQGYRSFALHPYPASNWNRQEVFADMSFEEFLSEPDFAGQEMLRGMCSDVGDYRRMIRLYEEQKDSPLFLFNVTIQNHGGYTDESFPSDIYLLENGGKAGTDFPQAEQYLTLAHRSDQAFEELVDYFERVEEPTMIVMFGDHQPKLEDGFYEYLTGRPASEFTQEETLKLYETPYVIWTNYPLEGKEQVPERMSASYLSAWVLQLAGLKLSEYDQYLIRLCCEVPVITSKGCLDAQGRYFQAYEGNVSAMLLREYSYLQYNNLFDEAGRLSDFWEEGIP